MKNDNISRQAAITALMEDAPEVWTDSDYELGMMNQHKYDVNVIKALPSAHPEIIRCKDCLMHGVCRFEQGLGLDGYCSQAERRTDG